MRVNRCVLSVGRCVQCVCCLVFVGLPVCRLCVGCCSLFDVCLLRVVCLLMCVVWSWLFDVCLLTVGCCLLAVVRLLFAVCCLVFAVCVLFGCVLLFVGCRLLFAVRYMFPRFVSWLSCVVCCV